LVPSPSPSQSRLISPRGHRITLTAFKTIEELRAELVAFARRYNETGLVARHGYKTPAKIREEQTMPQIAIDPTFAATLPLAA
jgi:putative transposase